MRGVAVVATEFGPKPKPSTESITARTRTGAWITVSGNLAHVARRVATMIVVFTGAVQFGQSAFAAWNWLHSVWLLW